MHLEQKRRPTADRSGVSAQRVAATTGSTSLATLAAPRDPSRAFFLRGSYSPVIENEHVAPKSM